MSSSCPIGVFDSGVGGLSILSKIHHLMPSEELIYLADSHHAPYGQKDVDYIQARCLSIMDFFQSQNVKAVVVACNTATAAAVSMLRERYSMPIVGMEPALKPAVAESRSGVVGVLATSGTIDSEKFIDLTSQYAEHVELITTACPGLVELIEGMVSDKPELVRLLEKYTQLFRANGGDTLVLGCTHYSLITELIVEVVGSQVKVVDTGDAVAKELQRRLQANNVVASAGPKNSVTFFSSGNLDTQSELISHYWGNSVEVRAI